MTDRVRAFGGRQRRGRRIAIAAIVVLGTIVGVASGVTVAAYPALGAAVCPTCYGLARLDDGLYVENGLSSRQQRRIIDVMAEADRRIVSYFGKRRTSPRTLVCVTSRCYDRIGGGGERGVAVLNRAVLLSGRGSTPVIAAHEMTHVELHDRLGRSGEVPQWFDEGLAVLVSDDPRYLRPAGARDRCRVEPNGPLPVTLREWLRTASTDDQAYARVGCQVSRWQHANGGRDAVLELIRRVGDGDDFGRVLGG